MRNPKILENVFANATHDFGLCLCESKVQFYFTCHSKMSAKHISFFLQLRDQLKLYHWQTRVYARHVATDQMLEKLEKGMDSFVEIFIGKYGRPRLTGANADLHLQNLTEAGAVRVVKAAIKYLQGPLTQSLTAHDTDLINLRDEILGTLDQLLYLYTLH
jgi:hypothetical protein